METAALSPHENIVLGAVNIQLDSQNCWTDNFNTVLSDFDFIQHVSTPTHIQGHILDVLCTTKSLTSSIHHYVKDGISDHLAVFFSTTFPVQNSCRVKRLKIRKIGKINKTDFMSDIANSELIQAPYKTASLLSHRYFHTLRNLLDKHVPEHEHNTPQHVKKGFTDSEILAAKRRKHKLEREWRRDNSAINRSRYRAAVNHFNRLLECAKTKYYSNMVRKNEDNPSIYHYVKDGISDHLAVFFSTTFPVQNSCRVKRLKIRKIGKINKTYFMSDIANSELIQAPYKTAK